MSENPRPGLFRMIFDRQSGLRIGRTQPTEREARFYTASEPLGGSCVEDLLQGKPEAGGRAGAMVAEGVRGVRGQQGRENRDNRKLHVMPHGVNRMGYCSPVAHQLQQKHKLRTIQAATRNVQWSEDGINARVKQVHTQRSCGWMQLHDIVQGYLGVQCATLHMICVVEFCGDVDGYDGWE